MGKNIKWCVYVHIVPRCISGYKNKKYYVGITSRKNPEVRWGKDGVGYKAQVFYNAIQKYGWDNIKHKILYTNLSEDEAKQKETELIALYDSTNTNHGYNITQGGEGLCGIKQSKTRPVYCVDLKQAFWSCDIASDVTGENNSTIRNKCLHFNRDIKKGYKWCYITDIYKLHNIKNQKHPSSKGKPVIRLTTNEIFSSCDYANYSLGTNFSRRGVLTADKYDKRLRGLNKYQGDKLMYLYDYLKLHDFTDATLGG